VIGGHPDEVDLTPEEERAITTLKRLAKRWPESLFIASMAGTLCVMRNDERGMHPETDGGGIDPEYMIDSIDINNTGGDW
jgi:hypothetical protein